MDRWPQGDGMDGPWSVVAGPEDAGQRLDRFLADRIGALSRSRVKGLIVAAHIAADGVAITDPAAAVRAGVAYTVQPPASVGVKPQPQAMALPIQMSTFN